jgi:starch phosphorylase
MFTYSEWSSCSSFGFIEKNNISEFNQLYPGKIQNKTNGVTPRRWIHCCNPKLSELLSDAMGGMDEWITSLENL